MDISAESAVNSGRIARRAIEKFGLDLQGLTVFTEAATGGYAYTPVMAALANADKVYACAADSVYGSKEEVGNQIGAIAEMLGCGDAIEIIYGKPPLALSEADIVTNSGFVRSIDRAMVSSLKSSAVVPLMWETWEWRPDELDLAACNEKGILVLGTNERHPLLSLDRATGFLAYKMLFEAGLEVYNSRVLLVSGCPTGDYIETVFAGGGVELDRLAVGDASGKRSPHCVGMAAALARLSSYDAIVVAEHTCPALLIGKEGLISPEAIAARNPDAQVIHLCGNIDAVDVRGYGISLHPPAIASWGYMSETVAHLGARPVIELNAAGLKVGEAMARARKQGLSIEEATQYALEHSPAMAFGPVVAHS